MAIVAVIINMTKINTIVTTIKKSLLNYRLINKNLSLVASYEYLYLKARAHTTPL